MGAGLTGGARWQATVGRLRLDSVRRVAVHERALRAATSARRMIQRTLCRTASASSSIEEGFDPNPNAPIEIVRATRRTFCIEAYHSELEAAAHYDNKEGR